MRQGGAPPEGKWIGSATGGVTAPDPIILPDPGKRFFKTAARLETLAAGHPMEDWLRFMAKMSRAQHEAATTLPPAAGPDRSAVAQAVEARMPPIAADGHRRDVVWREGLAIMLDQFADAMLPSQVQTVVSDLRRRDAAAIESLADDFLYGQVKTENVGPVLYVTAALQVYFTRLAASMDVSDLRLLPQRGLCPCCGSTPVSGVIMATGNTPGARYLYCSLCSTAWNHVRAVCITCGESRAIALEGIEGDAGIARAETCNDCHTYAKMIYRTKDTKADPYADDLASLGLDILASEAGWARHAPNPLLLMG